MIKMFLFKLPELVAAFMSFVQVLADQVPELARIAMEMIWAFLKAIDERILDISAMGVSVINNFILGIASKMTEIIDTAFNLLISFINGFAEAIRKYRGKIYDAAKNLLDAITGGISTNLFRIVEPIVSFVYTFIDTFVKAVADTWDKILEIGSNFVNGLIEGIKNGGKALWKAAKDVVSGAVDAILDFLDMSSPSKLTEEIGKFFDEGLMKGIDKNGSLVSDSATGVGENAVSAMQKALLKVDDLVSSDMDLTPVITPVIDLTNVKEGIQSIDQNFGSKKTLVVDGNISAAGIVAGQIKGSSSQAVSDAQTSQNQNITFNQNNYSPKALSRVEIYRQTKNQITSLKGVIVSS
jgi:phage-related protein